MLSVLVITSIGLLTTIASVVIPSCLEYEGRQDEFEFCITNAEVPYFEVLVVRQPARTECSTRYISQHYRIVDGVPLDRWGQPTNTSVADPPSWVTRTIENSKDKSRIECVIAAGWPFRAASIEYLYNSTRTARGYLMPGSGIVIDDQYKAARSSAKRPGSIGHSGPLRMPRTIPTRPIWSGFVANTAIHAGAIGVLFYGITFSWRLLRHRRGRCANCGYNLRGDLAAGCPECGWRRARNDE